MKNILFVTAILSSATSATNAFAETDCSNFSEWKANSIYTSGEYAKQDSNLYQANWWTRGSVPAENSNLYQEWSYVDTCVGDTDGSENVPPLVSLISPVDNSNAIEGDVVSLTAEASDNDGNIRQVDFYIDDVLFDTDHESPYQVEWMAAVGVHSIRVKAIDNKGATTLSAQNSIAVTERDGASCGGTPAYQAGALYLAGDFVSHNDLLYKCKISGWCSSSGSWAYAPGDGLHWTRAWVPAGACDVNVAPIVSIISPANNSVFLSGTNITITASATDADGIVDSVEFFADNISLGVDYDEPYEAQWNASGDYDVQLKVIATDDAGKASEATALVTVTNDIVVTTLKTPVSGTSLSLGDSLALTANASSHAANISMVEFFVDGQAVGSDNSIPFNVSWTPNAVGNYVVTAKATDGRGNSQISAGAMVSVSTVNETLVNETLGRLPKRTLVGYWHNFDNGSGYIRLEDVSPAWDVINLSFAVNKRGGEDGEVEFVLCSFGCNGVETEDEFKAAIKKIQSAGKIVNISLGGANARISLETPQARDNFVRTMTEIIETYNLNGLDIDLEGGSVTLVNGDNITVPRTPAIIHMIEAVKSLKAYFGKDFILTMAPETAYVQGGLRWFNGTGIWGAYLPLIDGLRADLSLLHVQHYNTGTLYGSDGIIYVPGTVDFHVAMTDMMTTGFQAGSGTDPANYFKGLRDDQLAFGLPSGFSSAGSGFTTIQAAQNAVTCLVSLTHCDNYVPAVARPNFRGLMSWSINWDQFDNYNFSTPHRAFMDELH